MRRKVILCDLCHKEIDPYSLKDKHFKIKIKTNELITCEVGHQLIYKKIDICKKCMEKIIGVYL